MKLIAAPLQGYTEASWRRLHASIFGGADEYYAPFLRIEKGIVRPKDRRDIEPEVQGTATTIPQLIFKNIEEFRIGRKLIAGLGYKRLDLNLGCPFPPQVNRGRGSGTISNTALLEEISNIIAEDTTINYSVKMRLGVRENKEWEAPLDILNHTPLVHICLHPRTAIQQYRGDIDYSQFERFLSKSSHPVIYNGEISTPQDINRIARQYPCVGGIMVGRGLLGRPSLFSEWLEGCLWDNERQKEKLIALHQAMYAHYAAVLCGEAQILSKMKPMWDYIGANINSRTLKAIKKATTTDKYLAAVASISQ